MTAPRRVVLAGAALAAAARPAAAQENTPDILAAGAAQHAVEALLAAWPGPVPRPAAAYDTVGAQRDRVRAGARPAVVVLTIEALAVLRTAGLIGGDPLLLGRTGVGLGARAASTLPEITDVETLQRALSGAESIAWADPIRGATAGRLFQRALTALAIDPGPRGRLFPFGGEAVAAAARGEVELAVSQATELHDRPGVRFLGYLPAPYQEWTTYAAAAVAPGERATAILAALAGPAGRAALRASGFQD